MLPRQWLTNLAHDVPISIWYDWHDDGPDPKEPEHHFGTVLHPYDPNRRPVYKPKPVYLAAQDLHYGVERLPLPETLADGDVDNVLLFTNGDETRLVAWTTSTSPHAIQVPIAPDNFTSPDIQANPCHR